MTSHSVLTEPRITMTRAADEDHVVHTVEGGGRHHRRRPCGGCPWRPRNIGTFPTEAFRLSAETAYDGAIHQFACHESGPESPTTCAGFLLRNAAHNLGTRLAVMHGHIDLAVVDDEGDELFANYREMAIANGVSPEDPVLAECRANDDPPRRRHAAPRSHAEIEQRLASLRTALATSGAGADDTTS